MFFVWMHFESRIHMPCYINNNVTLTLDALMPLNTFILANTRPTV